MSRLHTLLLRFTGPMQSWGIQSRFTIRDTALEPTKSGVIGLVCAALGRDRSAPIDDLAALRMGVRVDREGQKRRDYQTAGQSGFLRARGAVETSDVVPSDRYYLSDARFLVGLEGEDEMLLRGIHEALRSPYWPLSLGRKAFPPGLPVYLPDGLQLDTPLLDALKHYPWSRLHRQRQRERLRFVVEYDDSLEGIGLDPDDDQGPSVDVVRTQPDQPLSFQPRQFAMRSVAIFSFPVPDKAATST